MNGNCTEFTSKYKSRQIHSDEEEKEHSHYLGMMARINYSLTTNLVDKLVYDLAVTNKKDFLEKMGQRKKQDISGERAFCRNMWNFP